MMNGHAEIGSKSVYVEIASIQEREIGFRLSQAMAYTAVHSIEIGVMAEARQQ